MIEQFIDEQGQYLNRFKLTLVDESENSYDLTRMAEITQQGTPISADVMNAIVNEVNDHTADATSHVSEIDRNLWNGGAQYSPVNQLLNPCFEVNQRKNTIYAEPDYTFDRWWGNGNGVITRSANTAPTASAYMLDIVTNTLVSSSGFVLSQRIEEFDSKLVGKTVSYSIWMMADTPTELSIYIGGTAVTCNVTTSWQEFKGTITVDSTTESLKKGFQVYCAGSGATLHISSPQLVFGGYSGGFQPRPYSEELAMCQRYFFAADHHHCTGAFVNADGTKIVVGIPTPATMRTLTPSVKETTGTANIRANGSVYTNVSMTNPNPTGYRGTVMMAEFNCSGLTTQKNQPAAVSIMSTLSIDAEIYD